MLRSPSERRLWLAIRTASEPDHTGQTLLLDQMHRDLFVSETRLETLSILDGLVGKTPSRSGFHLVLAQHQILDEILHLIESDPGSVSSRYAVDMIDGWREHTFMADWARAQYPRLALLLLPLVEHHGLAGSPTSISSSSDGYADLIETWFGKFQNDLLSALDYILVPDQDGLIGSLRDRIEACLQEIDYEEIVDILLAIHDMCQMILEDRGRVSDQDIAEIRSRISSLYLTSSGQIRCRSSLQTISSQTTGSHHDDDIHPSDEANPAAELVAMFQSIAARDERVEPEEHHGLVAAAAAAAGFNNDEIDVIAVSQTQQQINTSAI